MNEKAAVPRISIIMPVYNDEAFVEEALASLLVQTEVDFEVIVCDDASKDRSAAVVDAFADRDPRVKALHNEANRGVCFTRNRAIAAAQGEWITLLDGDDFYHPDRLRKLVQFAEARDVDMVADGFLLVDEHSAITGEAFMPARQNGAQIDIEAYIEDGMPSGRRFNVGYLKPMIRRAFILRHEISYHDAAWCGQDFVFYFACLLHGAEFRLMNEALYYYRKYPRPRTLASKVRRTERHRENNRHMMSLAGERQDIVALLEKRDRYFDYGLRYEQLTAAAKSVNPAGIINNMKGDHEYWGFCGRMMARRAWNRLQRSRRKLTVRGQARSRTAYT